MREVNTIVHLGAGYCSELAHHMELDPEKIVLVEADPLIAEELIQKTADRQQCQVINSAVAVESGTGTFFQYNLSLLSGLCQVSDATRSLMPSLRLVDQFTVERVTPASLIASEALDPQQENLLIIDTPGIELPLLQSLASADALHLFKQLELHCHHTPFYEEGVSADAVLEWLYDQGYEVTENEEHDVDRPTWSLVLNRYKTENQMLAEKLDSQVKLANERQVEIEQLSKALSTQKQVNGNLESQIEVLSDTKAEQEKTVSVLQSQIEQHRAARGALEKLANERQVEAQQLSEALSKQKQVSGDLQSQVEELNVTKEEQEKAVGILQSQIGQLQAARSAQEKLAENYESRLQQKKSEIDNLQHQLDELNHRLPRIDEEFVKTEAQIELIKDILIREKAF